MLDDILLEVNKPGRYIGEEWNISRKDFARTDIKFALVFPDLYEVGMSNLGLRILYSILNNLEDVSCERFFAPDLDLERFMRQNRLEIFSLESKNKLKAFDLIGFSLGYELNYTNVLNVLDLGSLPLKASLRDQTYPLVIGGGPCALNPEPLHDFFDLFVIGEAEEVILEILDLYRQFKQKFRTHQMSKEDLLTEFTHLEGLYVPALYKVNYNSAGKIEEFKPKVKGIPPRIKKRIVKDLNRAPLPLDWLIPYIQIVHDRITLEIMRGCPNTCRFCQARSGYFPFRQRQIKNILNSAGETQSRTGYEEISLSGLSVSDYPGIENLLSELVNLFKEKSVSISLPSMKPKALVRNLPRLIATIKKTGLTFAPETGTDRLRKLIAKDFALEDFFAVLEEAYLSGYRHVKLYFMVGLPTEEEKDLDGIIEFTNQVSQLRQKLKGQAAQVNLSINTFIPKPHTPLQWLKMDELKMIKYKYDYLKTKINNRKINLNFHNRYMSVTEAVLSRGDRRLSQVILNAFSQGARFDAWDKHFDFSRWQNAFQQCNLKFDFYLQAKSLQEILPWDFLDVGISKEILLREFKKAVAIH